LPDIAESLESVLLVGFQIMQSQTALLFDSDVKAAEKSDTLVRFYFVCVSVAPATVFTSIAYLVLRCCLFDKAGAMN